MFPSVEQVYAGWQGVSNAAQDTPDYHYFGDFIDPTGIILEIALSQSIFTASPTWTDVSSYAIGLNTKRGRMHELDKVEAGLAAFALNNATGNWWRDNTAGAFYASGPLKPLTLIRLRYRYSGIMYPVWYGVIEAFRPGWLEQHGGFTPVMTLDCVDLFKTLSRFVLRNANPALTADAAALQKDVTVDSIQGDLVAGMWVRIYDDDNEELNIIGSVSEATYTITMSVNLAHAYEVAKHAKVKNYPRPAGGLHMYSGTRVDDVLTALGWPAALRDTDLGIVEVIEHTPPAGGTNALEYLQSLAEAEQGVLFIGVDGKVVFQDGEARTIDHGASLATFTDAGGNSKYALPELVDDDAFIYNEASIAGDGILEQVFGEPVSQALIGKRALTRKGSQLYSSSDALDQAFLVIVRYAASALRAESLLLYADVNNIADLLPKMLGYDISTRVTLVMNSTMNPAMLNRAYHIEGMEHEWKASEDLWKTKWQLWDGSQPFRVFREPRQTYHNGYVYNGDIGYANTHDAANGDGLYNDLAKVMAGQVYIPIGGYGIYRGLIGFDTSGLGASATLTEGYVIMAVDLSYEDAMSVIGQAFDLVLVNPSTVDYPLVLADYGALLPQVTSLGSVAITAGPKPQSMILVITLNAAGIALVNKTGTTYFALRSSRDIGSNAPADGVVEYLFLQGVGSTLPPRLIVKLA